MPKRLSCKAEVATNYSCWGGAAAERVSSRLYANAAPPPAPLGRGQLRGPAAARPRRAPVRRQPTALGRRGPDGGGRAQRAAGPGRRRALPGLGLPAAGSGVGSDRSHPGKGSASLSASLMSSPRLLPVAGRRTRVSLLIGGR